MYQILFRDRAPETSLGSRQEKGGSHDEVSQFFQWWSLDEVLSTPKGAEHAPTSSEQ